MAVKFVCDRCGSEDNVGRVVMSMAVSSPHKTEGLPKWDKELCAACLKEVAAMVPASIVPMSRS